jgi:hypothetical protein
MSTGRHPFGRCRQVERAREHALLQFENAGGGEQRRFRLKQIGAVDREQRVARLHFVADVVEGFENFALILREYLNEQILVEVDGADGRFQKREVARDDGSGLQRTRLLVRQIDGLFVGCRGLNGFGRGDAFLAAGLPVSQPDETPAPEQRGAADHNHGEQDRTGSRQLPESTHSKVPNFATRFMTLCDSVLCDAV